MSSGICAVKFKNGLLDIEMPTIVSLLGVVSRHTVVVFKSPKSSQHTYKINYFLELCNSMHYMCPYIGYASISAIG